jgi:hypothetical protein
MTAFRGKPRGIKPCFSSFARSCTRKRVRDLAHFVNKKPPNRCSGGSQFGGLSRKLNQLKP